MLYPTRLNVSANPEKGDTVMSNMLIVPTYGLDGRTQGINAGSVSAIYQDEAFIFHSDRQDYGVRAIGTIPGMSPQQTALAMESGATKADAANKLDALNAALTAAGGTAVTPANTLVISIPIGSERYEIVNAVEYPGVSLKSTRKTGRTTLGVIAVTRNGVVLNLSQDVTIFTDASLAEISPNPPKSLPVRPGS